MKKLFFSLLVLFVTNQMFAQVNNSISGVFPNLAMVANHSPRSEAGTGAMMPWANRLWIVTYTAHTDATGSGTGLYEVNEKMELKKRPESVVGTYANRLIHGYTHQLIIGPYVIDTLGNIRVIGGVKKYRVAATMFHLTEPEKKYIFFLWKENFWKLI